MDTTLRIQVRTDIAAPVGTVSRRERDVDGDRHGIWPFDAGSLCVGRWPAGKKIRFMSQKALCEGIAG